MHEDTPAQSTRENTPQYNKIIYTSHIPIKDQKINAGRPLFFSFCCMCMYMVVVVQKKIIM